APGSNDLRDITDSLGIPGTPGEFDASLNRPLGMPEGVYHFAFEAGTHAELEEKRAELIAKGVKVTPVVDHEWAKSIYFKDPNGLLLEYSYITREFTADDGTLQLRFEMSLRDESPITDFRDRERQPAPKADAPTSACPRGRRRRARPSARA